ncbi:MAG: ribose-phosphate diphosphokinase [Candidatus Methanomethyliaceae archaeon]|nr:ribose-phosphate diphosphokinase [Candidatus Methanomethyliaceae archaeon]MDW7971192.1 ribose-phosphate diphosphokinase [Nitrososphaerota archaeon]
MIVFYGPYSSKLGEKMAKQLNAKSMGIEHKIFPDGESYIRVPINVKGENVLLIQSTYPNQDKRIIELLLMIDALKDLGAEKVKVIVPYMAYARQDARFREGEAISIRTILKLIEAAGADEFFTVDIHKEFSLDILKIKAKNIMAVNAIAEFLRNMDLKSPFILSPDRGGLERARILGEKLGLEFGYFEKTRDRISGAITMRGEKIEFNGRDVVIVDDVISTGGTIATACRIAKEGRAGKVIAICTHALLINNAVEKMRLAGVDDIIATDTVEGEFSKITVAHLLAREVQ